MKFDEERILEINSQEKTITSVARKYCEENKVEYTDSIRRKVSRILSGEQRAVQPEGGDDEEIDKSDEDKVYQVSALGDDGRILNIKEFCEENNLPFKNVKGYKLITHSATPFYNIQFLDSTPTPRIPLEDVQRHIREGLEGLSTQSSEKTLSCDRTGIVKIADLHVGALVEELMKTKNFSPDILVKQLNEAAKRVNSYSYDKVWVHCLGDMIESFTGLNHPNSWKSMQSGLYGAEAVKACTRILHEEFLEKIVNLAGIKIVAGNHCRTTSSAKEDENGGAANLVAWGLDLIGYSVEFNPFVITHTIKGITHILTHGHHGISKKTTKQLCWDYGVQGNYNLICEGHLHSTIETLSMARREAFKTVKDDSVDHKRIVCPSFFTGNNFSERLGFTSQPGFLIVEDNGNKVPNIFHYSL